VKQITYFREINHIEKIIWELIAMSNTTAKKPHIVIVGAGFGGVAAAKDLANRDVYVTLVDRNNFHLFQPLLYQVSTACLSSDEIAYPVRAFFTKQRNVEFYFGEVLDFDLPNKKVITSNGEIGYDYLVMATGATTNYFGMETVEKNAFGMKTLEEAVTIRNHVLEMFEKATYEKDPIKRRQMLTFVCVGGGPTGVEEAGALSELIYKVLAKEFHRIDFAEVKIMLVEAMDKVLPMMPEKLRDETVDVLRKKGVDVRLHTQVSGYDGEVLEFKGGEALPTKTVIWSAGVKAFPITQKLGVEIDRGNRIFVNEYLHVPEHPELFAIGDTAHFEQNGRPLATIAPVATQEAAVATKNIMAQIYNKPMEKFVYHDVGSMATIGRGDAVMAKGSMQMSGLFAWIAWMIVHLIRLAGTKTNLTVLLKWIWNYFGGTRLSRIITKEQ